MQTAFDRLEDEEFGAADDDSRQIVATIGQSVRSESNPFDMGPVHRPFFALSAIEHATN